MGKDVDSAEGDGDSIGQRAASPKPPMLGSDDTTKQGRRPWLVAQGNTTPGYEEDEGENAPEQAHTNQKIGGAIWWHQQGGCAEHLDVTPTQRIQRPAEPRQGENGHRRKRAKAERPIDEADNDADGSDGDGNEVRHRSDCDVMQSRSDQKKAAQH